MYPRYFDNEFLLYVRRNDDPEALVGQESVVQLADGRVFVKILRKGTSKGLF